MAHGRWLGTGSLGLRSLGGAPAQGPRTTRRVKALHPQPALQSHPPKGASATRGALLESNLLTASSLFAQNPNPCDPQGPPGAGACRPSLHAPPAHPGLPHRWLQAWVSRLLPSPGPSGAWCLPGPSVFSSRNSPQVSPRGAVCSLPRGPQRRLAPGGCSGVCWTNPTTARGDTAATGVGGGGSQVSAPSSGCTDFAAVFWLQGVYERSGTRQAGHSTNGRGVERHSRYQNQRWGFT